MGKPVYLPITNLSMLSLALYGETPFTTDFATMFSMRLYRHSAIISSLSSSFSMAGGGGTMGFCSLDIASAILFMILSLLPG